MRGLRSIHRIPLRRHKTRHYDSGQYEQDRHHHHEINDREFSPEVLHDNFLAHPISRRARMIPNDLRARPSYYAANSLKRRNLQAGGNTLGFYPGRADKKCHIHIDSFAPTGAGTSMTVTVTAA